MIYRVYEKNLEALTKRLTRLNEKLVKIGALPVNFAVTGRESEPDPVNAGVVHPVVLLDVQGTVPQHNGWEFIATLAHTPDGNIIRSVPGFEIPPTYRDMRPACDHCKMNRLRRDTYVVRHSDGRTLQVGTNCLHDFLQHEHPEHITRAAELLLSAHDMADAAQDDQWLGSKNPRTLNYYRFSTRQFLGQVCSVVRIDGRYVTSKQSKANGGWSTAYIAKRVMSGHADMITRYPITDADFALADAAVAWVVGKYAPALGMETDGDYADFKSAVLGTLKGINMELSDFEHNLLMAARSEAIEPRLCGIAAYVIEAYRRSQLESKPVTLLDVAGLKRIFALFAAAANAQLKNPAIRLADDAGHHMVLSLASATSKNPGCIYVKGDRGSGQYFGKITPIGRFMSVANCPATVEGQLQAFAADPETVAAKYGKLTGRCCFCGRALTDERSTAMGYGPVCAHKFGLNWGAPTENTETVITA
jgi:hypothetical protein